MRSGASRSPDAPSASPPSSPGPFPENLIRLQRYLLRELLAAFVLIFAIITSIVVTGMLLQFLHRAPQLGLLSLARGLPYVLDETMLTLGAGAGGIDYPVDDLPAVDDVPWGKLRGIPTVVITGSNGKTTTVRLVAACARRQG